MQLATRILVDEGQRFCRIKRVRGERKDKSQREPDMGSVVVDMGKGTLNIGKSIPSQSKLIMFQIAKRPEVAPITKWLDNPSATAAGKC